MRNHLRVTMAFTLTGLLLVPLAACGGGGGASTPAAAEAAPDARTLPIPGASLPEGHPPMGDAVGAAGGTLQLGWKVPESWEQRTPQSRMRQAEYRVPGPGGDGECVVFYFGPGQGGEVMANAERWAGQFEQPDGGSSHDAMHVEKLEGTAVPVTLVEVRGTYDGGMTMTDQPAEARPGYMLLGGIAESASGPWFFKFTGPEATVVAAREAFVTMMESVREN